METGHQIRTREPEPRAGSERPCVCFAPLELNMNGDDSGAIVKGSFDISTIRARGFLFRDPRNGGEWIFQGVTALVRRGSPALFSA